MTLLRPGIQIHMVGIGGIGLSAIARVLHGWGYAVTGSDQSTSDLTRALSAEGITVYAGHRPDHVLGADLLVISSAIPPENPEIVEARRLGLPVVKREQFLADLTAGKTTIAVAGTHGKTTTSAMIAWILAETGNNPTFTVGGMLQNLETNAQAGSGPHFVIEADEYDRAFLGLNPDVAVVTTLEHDHPDCYPTFAEMREAFQAFVDRLVPGGLLVVCGDDTETKKLGSCNEVIGRRVETYGLGTDWDWRAEGAKLGNSASFSIWYRGAEKAKCALQLPGQHNVLNALAALAATHEAGVPFGDAVAALARFRGTARRFEVKGHAAGITIVDDYAHHPTEIRATLAAARQKYPGRPVWAIFQPHTYSRTATLLDEFAAAFGNADHVLITSIYAARENNRSRVSGQDVVARSNHPDASYVSDFDSAVQVLQNRLEPGDVVFTLGAGDGYLIGERLLAALQERDSSR